MTPLVPIVAITSLRNRHVPAPLNGSLPNTPPYDMTAHGQLVANTLTTPNDMTPRALLISLHYDSSPHGIGTRMSLQYDITTHPHSCPDRIGPKRQLLNDGTFPPGTTLLTAPSQRLTTAGHRTATPTTRLYTPARD